VNYEKTLPARVGRFAGGTDSLPIGVPKAQEALWRPITWALPSSAGSSSCRWRGPDRQAIRGTQGGKGWHR
jgi:hypothetical protein